MTNYEIAKYTGPAPSARNAPDWNLEHFSHRDTIEHSAEGNGVRHPREEAEVSWPLFFAPFQKQQYMYTTIEELAIDVSWTASGLPKWDPALTPDQTRLFLQTK